MLIFTCVLALSDHLHLCVALSSHSLPYCRIVIRFYVAVISFHGTLRIGLLQASTLFIFTFSQFDCCWFLEARDHSHYAQKYACNSHIPSYRSTPNLVLRRSSAIVALPQEDWYPYPPCLQNKE